MATARARPQRGAHGVGLNAGEAPREHNASRRWTAVREGGVAVDYLDQMAALVGGAQICTASIRLFLCTDDGDAMVDGSGSPWRLPGGDLGVGEGFRECATRIARTLGIEVDALRSAGTVGAVLSEDAGGLVRYDLLTVITGSLRTGACGRVATASMDRLLTVADERTRRILEACPSRGEPPYFDPPTLRDHREGVSYWRVVRRLIGAGTCLILPAVAVLMVTRDGRVVLVRSHEHDVWMIPGGIIEFGESIADAVVREAREETGLLVTPQRLTGCYSGEPFLARYRNGDVVQIASFPCVARIDGGTLRTTDSAQIRDVDTFSPTDLPAMYPHWRRVLTDALAGRFGTVV